MHSRFQHEKFKNFREQTILEARLILISAFWNSPHRVYLSAFSSQHHSCMRISLKTLSSSSPSISDLTFTFPSPH
ncbi:hypothetical protein VIGAN_06022600, partial [Vigna angularis var. angularis]